MLAGLVLWFAALDAVEAMAQDIDHPGLQTSFPVDKGDLMVRHLPASIVLMVVASGIAAGVALVPGGGSIPAGVAGMLVVTLALLPPPAPRSASCRAPPRSGASPTRSR